MKNIAFFTPSLDQISESFIRLQITILKPKLIFYSGYDTKKYIHTLNNETFKIVRLRHMMVNKLLPNAHKFKRDKLVLKVLKTHKIDLLVFQYSLTAINNYGWLKDCKIPFIIHFHGFDISCDYIFLEYNNMLKCLVERASGLISVSTKMTKRILDVSTNIRGTILTQPCPPSMGILKTTSKNKMSNDKKATCIIINGRFVNKKAPFFHLFVIKRVIDILQVNTQDVPKFYVEWVGNGILLEAAENLSKQLKLSDIVNFNGALSHSEAINIVELGDIFLQFSHLAIGGDREGTPVSLLEAGLIGLACIGTRHEGIEDIIDHGINGYLVEEGDIETAASYLVELLSNHVLRDKFGLEISNKINSKYNEEIYFEEMTRLFYSASKHHF
jgi:glycosyltransferase involved in cell wall biosynthesis